jgi:hypothetical protein
VLELARAEVPTCDVCGQGTLAPGETIELHFVVNVTPAAAARLRGNDELSDIVVLHIANGRDIFVRAARAWRRAARRLREHVRRWR